MTTTVSIPELSLVVLIGASGSGKSTFARQHFGGFESISSDFCRGLVSGDENNQAVSADAFDVLGYIVGKRLAAGRLTVVDATNVTREARRQFIELAREHDVLPVAIVLDTPVGTAIERNAARPDRTFGARVINRQHDQLRRSLRGLGKEGFRSVQVITADQADDVEIVRTRLLNDRRDDHGPFDVIGDVHGCRAELETLLTTLGYALVRDAQGRAIDAEHPDGRQALFLGDLVDRGPDTPGVLRLAMGMTAAGHALAIAGNHEHKLVRALKPERGGRRTEPSHGQQQTLDQLAAEPEEFVDAVRDWCRNLIAHLVLDDGRLVVAHAGLKESYHGRASGRVRSFALYGDTTGDTDEYGLPVRLPWAEDYRGKAMVLYGHTPVPEAVWVNNTMCLDTGCVFGGRLTALRYPEKELVDVAAEQTWCEPAKPFRKPTRSGDDLELDDVLGHRVIETVQQGRVTIGAEQAAGAFEVMSRFALHPRWLGYLPPTMAPARATSEDGYLEYPDTAFAEYADAGVATVICEEKHMGSRAVITVCADAAVAVRHFGVPADSATQPRTGVIHTRTGRTFTPIAETEDLLAGIRAAIGAAGLWQELGADWLMLDAELLPWSLKADPLLRDQYAATSAAAEMMLPVAQDQLRATTARGIAVDGLDERVDHRLGAIEKFVAAYRRYQWPTQGWQGVQLAPFQLLAAGSSEGSATYENRHHGWHLELADRLVAADPELFRTTRRLVVETGSPDSVRAGIDWWTELTGAGGEGMVVKPYANLDRRTGGRSRVQPGMKVRGREYLRLIYGPDYLRTAELSRLKQRNLGHKRSLALREYALGLEALRRLTTGEPLWRVHEAVFGVLALESDAVDPRL